LVCPESHKSCHSAKIDSFTYGWQNKLVAFRNRGTFYRARKPYKKTESNIIPLEIENRGKRKEPLAIEYVAGTVPPASSAKSVRLQPKAPKSAAKKKRSPKNPAGTPLQRFKKQTLAKRAELKKARKDIDKELKAIEKDLGILKRK
jgi:hypothetical protein